VNRSNIWQILSAPAYPLPPGLTVRRVFRARTYADPYHLIG
jgi:hypothetical protein